MMVTMISLTGISGLASIVTLGSVVPTQMKLKRVSGPEMVHYIYCACLLLM